MGNYNIYSKKPLAIDVSPEILRPARFDLDFYLPERIETEDIISKGQFDTAQLDSLRLNSNRITDGIRRHDKSETGIHLIRTQNLTGPEIDFERTAFVDLQ